MIDAISIKTVQRGDNRIYDVARLWVGGVPFSADLTASVEATTRRIAAAAGIEITDHRPVKAQSK